MVERLAACLLQLNPLLLRAMRITYSHVFLDEYQDTTPAQYDLVGACFKNSRAILTAVGDNKQRIMLWAGAMPDAFTRFEHDFSARRVRLFLNYRSDSELVRIQQFLIETIDPDSGQVSASEANSTGDGVCEVLAFSNAEQEARHLAQMILSLRERGVKPRDICILTRLLPNEYCATLLSVLRETGVRCRVEVEYQDLLDDTLVSAVLAMLRLAVDGRNPECWADTLELVCLLTATDPDDHV